MGLIDHRGYVLHDKHDFSVSEIYLGYRHNHSNGYVILKKTVVGNLTSFRFYYKKEGDYTTDWSNRTALPYTDLKTTGFILNES